MLSHDPRKIFLFINYFVSDNVQRQEEIDFCVQRNVESPYFDRVTSIGKDCPKHPKVHYQRYWKRPNYRQFIEHCNNHHQGEICVVANLDITFDDTIWLLRDVDLSNTFVALTRWKNELASCDGYDAWDKNVTWSWGFSEKNAFTRKLAPKGSYTQDVWVFKAPLRINPRLADMTMGYMGCDNKIAHIAKEAGYRVVNPSKSIKTVHWHNSEYRTYDNDSRLDVDCPVVPCFIEDII